MSCCPSCASTSGRSAAYDAFCLSQRPPRDCKGRRHLRTLLAAAAANSRTNASPSLQAVSPEPVPVVDTSAGVSPRQPLRNYEVSLWDAMKFGGPAPHIINFRLAMVGFVWGAKQEFQTSRTLVEQAASRPVLVAAVVALTAWASLVPIMKGVKCEAFGKFSPKAEVINGRAACLGFAILLLLESRARVPFF